MDAFTALGHDHPIALRALNNLVRSQDSRFKPAQSQWPYEKVITDQRLLLGPGHRDTFRTRRYLASWRLEAKDLLGALAEFETLVKDQVAALGNDHPDALFTEACSPPAQRCRRNGNWRGGAA